MSDLMDCKGYDIFPDGTMRPAHGLGEWVKAEDYDKLHATATTAQAQRDKAIEFLQVYRNDTPLGHQPHMIAHEVDQFLKECGK